MSRARRADADLLGIGLGDGDNAGGNGAGADADWAEFDDDVGGGVATAEPHSDVENGVGADVAPRLATRPPPSARRDEFDFYTAPPRHASSAWMRLRTALEVVSEQHGVVLRMDPWDHTTASLLTATQHTAQYAGTRVFLCDVLEVALALMALADDVVRKIDTPYARTTMKDALQKMHQALTCEVSMRSVQDGGSLRELFMRAQRIERVNELGSAPFVARDEAPSVLTASLSAAATAATTLARYASSFVSDSGSWSYAHVQAAKPPTSRDRWREHEILARRTTVEARDAVLTLLKACRFVRAAVHALRMLGLNDAATISVADYARAAVVDPTRDTIMERLHFDTAVQRLKRFALTKRTVCVDRDWLALEFGANASDALERELRYVEAMLATLVACVRHVAVEYVDVDDHIYERERDRDRERTRHHGGG